MVADIADVYNSLNEEIKQNTFTDFKLNKSEDIPLIILHTTDIYVFYEVKNSDCRKEIMDKLHELQKALNLSIYHFIPIGILENSEWVYLDVRNNEIKDITNINLFLDENFSERLASFTDDKIEEIYNKLLFLDNSDNKIKVDKDGNVFIKKGKEHYKASEEDSDKLFWITLFGGWLGLHKFIKKDTLHGVLYLLTVGLFGFGWLFDVISLLVGTQKDNEGLYLLLLDNASKKALLLLILIPVAIILVFLYYKGFLSLVYLLLNQIDGLIGG